MRWGRKPDTCVSSELGCEKSKRIFLKTAQISLSKSQIYATETFLYSQLARSLHGRSKYSPAPAPNTPPSNQTQSTMNCSPPRGRGPESVQDHNAVTHSLRRAATGQRNRTAALQTTVPPTQTHTTPPPTTTTGWRKDRCPVVRNRALHNKMKQRCHHASASARRERVLFIGTQFSILYT